jgi:hypothetical protein
MSFFEAAELTTAADRSKPRRLSGRIVRLTYRVSGDLQTKMFGIRGLDAFGFVHALLGIAAQLAGLTVLFQSKGTRSHRRFGTMCVLSMFALNITALMIYDLFGRAVSRSRTH